MAIEGGVFTVDETHGRALRAANRLIAHSQDAGWRSLYAAVLEEAPLRTREFAVGHPSLIYHLSRPTEVTRKIDGGRRERALIGPRRICLTPARSVAQWQHDGRPQILQLYLRSSVFADALRERSGRDVSSPEIEPRFAIVDPLLEQLALAVVAALEADDSEDGLYIDSLAQMIAVHLARHYSAGSSRAPAPRAARTDPRLARLLEYVDAHLGEDLSLETMAAEIDVGPLQLTRMLKTATGQTPHQYILRLRIERARALLRDTDLPIIEIALATGFCSQSHLSNWFRRLVGVPPGVYRSEV